MKCKCVILDRDGVINHNRDDHVKTPEEMVFIPGALQSIARLNEAGMKVAVATNQSGVARGWLTLEDLTKIHQKLIDSLKEEGGHIDQIYFAGELPEGASIRRKPGPGMLLEAMELFGVTPEETIMIGDNITDMQAAKNAGVRHILVQTGHGPKALKHKDFNQVNPIAIVADINEAIDTILTL